MTSWANNPQFGSPPKLINDGNKSDCGKLSSALSNGTEAFFMIDMGSL
eukprot:CAMPEP_0202974246 /NCGR_PEP_ID=MMETSP1396-20130829/58780_1 /ASSEMBLY_ACC=CAM_ASM_000872 /TAXON_ID= /ORGANISM="Pseudokeronopsis sp., Strain Brazil" /LENGTH=47 /DNA_ID= /DNA_START= /DNA_END= /DNA_ORIENTATION=